MADVLNEVSRIKMVHIDSKEIMAEFATANLTDPKGRLSSNTETFSGDGSTKEFDLNSGVKAVTDVRIGGSSQTKWEDYIVVIRDNETDNSAPRIEFYNAPTNGTDNIDVDTKEGTGWIYPDLPRTDLSSSSFPRIGITNRPESGNRQGTYEADIEYFTNFRVLAYDLENEPRTVNNLNLEGDRLVNHLLSNLLQQFRDKIDEMYPELYDFNHVTGPAAGSEDNRFDMERQVFSTPLDFMLKELNIGKEVST